MEKAEKYKEDFLKISALLTGFREVELQGTGLVSVYYKTVADKTEASVLTCFFDKVGEILKMQSTDQDGAIRSQLIPDSSYKALAKKITLMWYEGLWVEIDNKGVVDRKVISAQSYIEGLMWPAAKTHPSGAKQPGFGSWSEPPL